MRAFWLTRWRSLTLGRMIHRESREGRFRHDVLTRNCAAGQVPRGGASAGFGGANVLVLGGEVGGDVFGPQFFE